MFEVEIRQIHVPVLQDMNGEDIPPLFETNFEKRRRKVSVVPLRHANGSAASFVDMICSGPVASLPFTSSDIVPPRFDVYRKSTA